VATGRTPQQEQLAAIVRRFPQRKIVVVGDLVADQFLYGEITRVSREAPVLILRYERTVTTPGGAANCAANLSALDARAVLIGAVGQDEAGSALLEKLREAKVESSGIISSATQRTTTKVRILAGQLHSTRQQVIRIDYEGEPLSDEKLREQLRARLREEAETADAIIISDYNYGVADELMAEAAREVAQRRGIPVLVDSRFRLARFPNFASATPNEDEVEQLLGRQLTDTATLEAAGVELRQVISRPDGHDWSGPTGYVQSLLEHVLPALHAPVALICGSSEMIGQTRDRLQQMGFSPEAILTNY